jgi:hypothetical protein
MLFLRRQPRCSLPARSPWLVVPATRPTLGPLPKAVTAERWSTSTRPSLPCQYQKWHTWHTYLVEQTNPHLVSFVSSCFLCFKVFWRAGVQPTALASTDTSARLAWNCSSTACFLGPGVKRILAGRPQPVGVPILARMFGARVSLLYTSVPFLSIRHWQLRTASPRCSNALRLWRGWQRMCDKRPPQRKKQ